MDIRFRPATQSDELTLKRLFLACFDDTLGFVNMFFAHHFIPENTLVAEVEGRAVGLSFFLPCEAEGKPCFYIYGVCVSPDMRGQGIGTKMLTFTTETAQKNGARVLLMPQGESLFAFYEKAGFKPCSYYKKQVFTAGGEAAEFCSIAADEYTALRNEGLKSINPVLWDTESVEYALAHETFFGGRAYKFRFGNETGIVLCTRDGGTTYIKETTASEKALPAVAAAAIKIFGGDEITAIIPSDESGSPYAFGIGFTRPVYLNLMLD